MGRFQKGGGAMELSAPSGDYALPGQADEVVQLRLAAKPINHSSGSMVLPCHGGINGTLVEAFAVPELAEISAPEMVESPSGTVRSMALLEPLTSTRCIAIVPALPSTDDPLFPGVGKSWNERAPLPALAATPGAKNAAADEWKENGQPQRARFEQQAWGMGDTLRQASPGAHMPLPGYTDAEPSGREPRQSSVALGSVVHANGSCTPPAPHGSTSGAEEVAKKEGAASNPLIPAVERLDNGLTPGEDALRRYTAMLVPFSPRATGCTNELDRGRARPATAANSILLPSPLPSKLSAVVVRLTAPCFPLECAGECCYPRPANPQL